MSKKNQSRRKTRFCPTQKDIADALGVAQSTVAMALNPATEHKLLAETVERIRSYATSVGYHPQRFAQIMQGGHTRIIGVIVRLGIYTKNQEMVSMLANELTRAGYRLVVVDPVWFEGDHEEVKKYLLDQGVEGVMFCNVTLASEAWGMESLLPPTMPIFGIQSTLKTSMCLSEDLQAAYYHMTRLHMALGSRRLGLLSIFRDPGHLDRATWTVRDRALGFSKAIQDAGGVVVADDAVREIMEIPGCQSLSKAKGKLVGTITYPEKTSEIRNAYENGYTQALCLMGGATPPDSLICGNDDAATGVLAACTDRGISVPGELRVSGHDDTMAGRFASVPIATIRPPLEAMIKIAADKLLARIQNPESSKPRSLAPIPCEIIAADSIGTPDEISRLSETGFFNETRGIRFNNSPLNSRTKRFESFFNHASPNVTFPASP